MLHIDEEIPMAETQLSLIQNMPDPMLTFRWVAKTLPFGLPLHYIEGCDVPFNNIQVSEGVFVGGKYVYYAGSHSIQPFSLTIYEDRKGTGLAWINYWKSQVKDFQTGAYKLPKDYKRDIEIQQIDQKGLAVVTTKLIGCWPSDTAPVALNYTDGTGRIIYQQTMSVDDRKDTMHQSPQLA